MNETRRRTLALGSPESAFYRSLRQVLLAFGEIEFVNERDIEPPNRIVELVERQRFDQVLMPNPYGNPQRLACYQALREHCIPVIASDRGSLPDSWFFDAGFNADSPSYDPSAWDHPLSVEQRERVRRYMAALRGSDVALEQQGPRRGRDELRSRLGLGDAKVLFVPLQRPDDTVVRYFSGAVRSLDDMVEIISRTEKRMAEIAGGEWRVILKKHPLEQDYIIPSNGRLKYVPDDVHVHDLLEIATAVLVLNSGVGVLSLIFGKPTLHFGVAKFGHPGLAVHVDGEDALVEALRILPRPDPEKVERFVHHLTTRVYSFASMKTELVRQRDGSMARVTRDMRFRELRILGKDAALPDAHVLVVTPVVPWPIYRGSQSRIDTMIRSLLADNKLVSLCVLNMSFDRPAKDIVRELRARYPAVDRIEVRRHPKFDKKVRRGLYALMKAADVITGGRHRIANLDTCPPAFRRAVAKLASEIEPDYILVNYAKLTPALPRSGHAVAVIDTHDYQTQFLREDQELNGARRFIRIKSFEASEIEALRRYDRIIAISPLEAETFRRLCPNARVHCVPAFTEPRPSRDIFIGHRYEMLFVGSMSNFNVSGLRWFVELVLPVIRARSVRARLAVVGNIVRSREASSFRSDGVELVGVVDDLRPYYEQSRVVVAPLLGGAGMKIKVVEALGYGKAIVCTTRAAEGIALRHGETAWIADDPIAFADGVARLLSDDELRRTLERNAAALHAEQHSPQAVARALASVFNGEERAEGTTAGSRAQRPAARAS